jgi:hypothetical protein
VVFTPRLLSAGALQKGMERTVLDFFSLSSAISRLGLFHRNPFIWWLVNLSFRRYYRHKWNGHR